MIAIKGIYEDGKLTLEETAPATGPVEVVVVFPEVVLDGDARWEEILNDPRPRPALEAMAKEVLADFAAGKCESLDLDKL